MQSFIQRHRNLVIGMLNGFDRLRFRGSKRLLCNVGGMYNYLWQVQVLLKDFKDYTMSLTEQLRQATVQLAEAAGRPLRYLASSSLAKEDLARDIARRDGVTEGLIAIFSAVEPCWSYHIHRNRDRKKLDLVGGPSKCLHYYHYYQHRQLGFLNVRLQTWFPFTIHICINGREWLARQLDAVGIGYLRRDNCFVDIAKLARAQQLADRQLKANWPRLLEQLAALANPVHRKMFAGSPVPYYWSAQESEWASDVLFRSTAALSELYGRLIHHGMTTHSSGDVMRFLGRSVPARGGVSGNFKGQVVSDLKTRPEGIRIKHRVDRNSIKMYNKQGSVLRVETTINEPRDFKAFRPKEGDKGGQKQWRYLRRGVADLHRRAEVCQAANERYLEAMATVKDKTPLSELTKPVCQAVRWKGKPVRAINPLNEEDAALLEAVNRGEFMVNGFRNRDLRYLMYNRNRKYTKEDIRRQSSVITRKLRMLRAHGLIRKVPHTHRYMVSSKGRSVITTLLIARQADIETLTNAA